VSPEVRSLASGLLDQSQACKSTELFQGLMFEILTEFGDSHGTLHHGVGQAVIALWLGHESVETTQMDMHADLRLKENALARVSAPESKPGRYRPDDSLLAFLAKSCRTAASDCLVFIGVRCGILATIPGTVCVAGEPEAFTGKAFP